MRPKIICHMMSSVDGRLHMQRWSKPYGKNSFEDIATPYFKVSDDFGAQGVLIGRTTFQEHYTGGDTDFTAYPPAKEHTPYIGVRQSNRSVIVLDPKGKVVYEDDAMWGENIIAVLSEQVSEEYMAHLREKGISYLFAGKDGKDLGVALETLSEVFGMNLILLEGGAIINGAFLKAGLIDELSLMIYPGIDGLSGMPSIFEYIGKADELPASGQSLELIDSEVMADGLVRLLYKFHKY